MIRRITRSLSARLLGIFLLTSIVYAFASRYVVDLVWGTGYLSEVVGAHMALHVDYVLNDIGQPPQIERAKAIVAKVPMDIMLLGPDLNWSSSDGFPPLEDVPFERSEFLRVVCEQRDQVGWVKTVQLLEFARYQRRAFVKIVDGPYQIIFASPKFSEDTPAGPDHARHRRDLDPGAGRLLLRACNGWCSPIKWLKEGAARIGQGDLDYRIPTTRKDDLGELAADINHMADDVREMLEAKRQLLLAISHELRSPLTRAKVALEFLEDQSVKANLMQDIKEMERLIADLLESERLNTRHSKLAGRAGGSRRAGCRGRQVRFRGPGAAASRSSLPPAPVVHRRRRHAAAPARQEPDRERAALHAGGRARRWKWRCRWRAISRKLQVCDHGRGMSAHDLARITEPFYRADPARSRATGGLGLGLYLCRRIAEAHGGSLKITSELGCGTEVTVRLPCHAAAPS